MTRTEHLLTILGEECNEVAQRASKAMRFGLSEIQEGQTLTNAERILGEYADLVAVLFMLQDVGALPNIDLRQKIADKQAKVEKWLKYSAQCGTMEDK